MLRSKGMIALAALAVLVACAEAEEVPEGETVNTEVAAADEQVAMQDLACQPSPRMPVEGRASAYDSTMVPIGSASAKICYGRPALKGRTMIGGEAVPYGKLWRTGANEPTTIHLPVAAQIAGIAVQPGSYSLYTIPGQDEWVLIVNRSTSQWGHEGQYTDQVRAQEVGRATVRAEQIDDTVELFTIRSEPSDGASNVVLEWQNTRVLVPVTGG